MVGDSCELRFLASPALDGVLGWGLGSSTGSTFTPGLGRIRLSPRRGSVSRASIHQPAAARAVLGCGPAPGGAPPAESRPGCSRDSSCPAAGGHGWDTAWLWLQDRAAPGTPRAAAPAQCPSFVPCGARGVRGEH